MRGNILGYMQSSRTGTITGDDGCRYGFTQSEWRSDDPVRTGSRVDFEVRGEEAIGVYPVLKDAPSASSTGRQAPLRRLWQKIWPGG